LPTIVLGMPNNLMTHLNSREAVSLADTIIVVGRKWANFVSLSTTTKIASFPWDGGKLVMKSSMMTLKGLAGMSKGCRNPYFVPRSCLIF
jgi:hypothetical protein